MEVFRLCREKYAAKLSGKGAALKGGRWNSTGIEMIYTAGNRSLAMAEVSVHFSVANVPPDYMMSTIFIPDNITLKKITVSELPKDWDVFPYNPATQIFGDLFINENKHTVLQVPSAITPGDFNFLINPHHQDFPKIKLLSADKFPFNRRLFNK